MLIFFFADTYTKAYNIVAPSHELFTLGSHPHYKGATDFLAIF